MTFNQFVRIKRERLGLSQQQLTNACGFAHRSEISKLEAGKLEWKLNHVMMVAALFGQTASELLAEYEQATN